MWGAGFEPPTFTSQGDLSSSFEEEEGWSSFGMRAELERALGPMHLEMVCATDFKVVQG
jgi:hypothetical protein